MSTKQTAIVTGASQGIGAALVEALLNADYNVVATSRNVNQALTPSSNLVLVAGDIGKQETATKVSAAAIENFGTIDLLVTNAGIFSTKPFTEFTTDDFNALVSTNLLGFLYITQLAVAQMQKQKAGAVVSITAALADQPIAGVNAAVPMITKGGLNAVIKSLAIEYAKEGIRFNAVAPGIVDTPMHTDDPISRPCSRWERSRALRMSLAPCCSSRTRARSPERCSTSTVDRTQAGGNRNRSPRRLPERGRWMVLPIAAAVHRLPPSRVSLARGGGLRSCSTFMRLFNIRVPRRV